MADIGEIKAAQGATKGDSSQTTQSALVGINREFEEKAARTRAKDLNLPYVDVAFFPINPDILHVLPLPEAKRGQLMPFYRIGKLIKTAVFDPDVAETKEAIELLKSKGYEVDVHIASKTGINDAYKAYASDQYKLKEEVKNVVNEMDIQYEKELKNLTEIKDQISVLPAEEALNLLSVSAIKAGASDIHYQPEESKCTIRFRIDGVLHNVFDIPKEVNAGLANQLKYKAGMKLNITNVPQDGRFRFVVNDRKIDVRVSGLPTEFGESFVCRILDSGKHFDSFDELGFTGKALEVLNKAKDLNQGMVLVTGPTSSGKTTSLYVLLTRYNTPDVKIITLEDPIEYHLSGITQSQVNEKRGYTFADGLRSILRQDPDIVMIGEIRDLETAQVCAQAALTGHVVLSTIHTNSAIETVQRLINIGLPASTIASSVSVVVAQRLLRKVCDSCAVLRPIAEEEKKIFERAIKTVAEVSASNLTMPSNVKIGKGCEACNFTGFRGQMVVSEVFEVNDTIRDMILNDKSAVDLLAAGRKNGMLTMFEDAILKAMEGKTTIAEVLRVVG